MPTINITVRNKIAKTDPAARIVCSNSDYTVHFDFDAEWDAYPTKTARFTYGTKYIDAIFEGSDCPAPAIPSASYVWIGVYAGNLHTSTPALIPTLRSAISGTGAHEEPGDATYNRLMETLTEISTRSPSAYEYARLGGYTGTEEEFLAALASVGTGGSVTAEVTAENAAIRSVNHRGYSVSAPENTLPAFILSRKQGFRFVECDVSFTSDNVPVLLHDGTVDRTSSGSGSISEMTFAAARALDFGAWKGAAYAGTKIPSLAEFLALCRGLGLHPYVELKQNGSYTEAQIRQIVSAVRAAGMAGNVTYISFSAVYLGYVKTADPAARLGYLVTACTQAEVTTAMNLKTGSNEVFLDMKYENLTDAGVALCVGNSLPLEVWTVNDPSLIRSMDPYVSGITSDSVLADKVLREYYSTARYLPDDAQGGGSGPDVPVKPDEPGEGTEQTERDPVIDLDLAGYSGGAAIANLGALGSAYNAAVKGSPRPEDGALVLAPTDCFTVPRALTADKPFTWLVQNGAVTTSACQWGRLMRGSGDVPSVYMLQSAGTWSAKIAGAGMSLGSVMEDYGIGAEKRSQWVFTGDGTGAVSLYINGALYKRETGFAACASIGCGDTDSAGYAFTRLPVQRFAVWNRTLTDTEILALYTASGIADDPVDDPADHLPAPAVDLDFASYTGGAVLANRGTDGETANADVTGTPVASGNSLVLTASDRFVVPKSLEGTAEWTWIVKIDPVEPAGRTWGRVMRGSNDMPSVYMNLTEKTFSAKTVGAGMSMASLAESHRLSYTKENSFAFVCDGARGVSLYVNGVFWRKDTGFTAVCSEIGCGDTNGANYYFNEMTVQSFRVYDQALTAEEIALLA